MNNWLSDVDNMAKINEWNNTAKYMWLCVRLNAWKCPHYAETTARQPIYKDYAGVKVALINRFDPPSKKYLYAAGFTLTKNMLANHGVIW